MAQNKIKHLKKWFGDSMYSLSRAISTLFHWGLAQPKKVSFGRIMIFKFPKTFCSFCSLSYDHKWTEKSAFNTTAIAHMRNFWADSVYPWYRPQSMKQAYLSPRPGPRRHLLCDDFPAQMDHGPQHDGFDHSEPTTPGAQAHIGNPKKHI